MNKIYAISLVLTAVAMIWFILTPSTASYSNNAGGAELQEIDYVVKAIEPVKLRSELIPICSCESGRGKYGTPTHYEADGVTVLRGIINNRDVGVCQINLDYHEETAKKMYLDLFKEEDNITYANYLYGKSGSQPWFWSASCWQ